LVIGKEGVEVARWLNELGFHAFVLVHRFPNARFGSQAPLDDAIEAVRQIRARSGEFGIGPPRHRGTRAFLRRAPGELPAR